MSAQDCLFCKIVAGSIPAQVVWQDATATAFRDLNPQAPVHVLIVPNRHVASIGDLAAEDDALGGELLRTAAQLAEQEGIAASGYRVVINTGPAAGQSVAHLHLHLLGGRRLGWPPG
ncbi:MAG: histidine triad nucleotide-binding protein [Chloroflexi bacterium]|nr:histidine triad nucleotide-binding protein [Chloroflexota bacterium]